MSSIYKILMPSWVKYPLKKAKRQLLIAKDFYYDYKRFVNSSISNIRQEKEHLKALLLKDYHAIEKGLALPEPKPGFGKDKIIMILKNLEVYKSRYGEDYLTESIHSTLKEYIEFDIMYNTNQNYIIDKIKKDLKEEVNDKISGGTKTVLKKQIEQSINFNFNQFFKSRYSTRNFSKEPVNTETVLQAIDTARYTPSVCNRQAWKVYIIDHNNEELKLNLLKVQNGNRGFGENISTLIVITGKLSSFLAYERNQVYIDGGMFAMSVVLSLHSKGLGTCCLNTSYTAERSEEFRKVVNIDEDCVPIMFIAVGNLKDNYKVAQSCRKPLSEIAEVIYR